MKATHPVVEVLQGLPLFAGLRERDLRGLVTEVDLPHFRPGQVLMLEHFHGDQLHVIVDGEVEVTRHGEQLAVLGPGAVIGEVGMLTGADRNATVTCLTAVRTVTMEHAAFDRLVTAFPEVSKRLWDDAARHRDPAVS